jgi:hypothetical protein
MLPSTPISAIVPGKLDFQVRVRVIHLWIVPDRMKPTEDGTIQMLFLDDKVSILCLYLNALYIFLNLVYVYLKAKIIACTIGRGCRNMRKKKLITTCLFFKCF